MEPESWHSGYITKYNNNLTEEECVQNCVQFRYCVGAYYEIYWNTGYCRLFFEITSLKNVSLDGLRSARRTIMVNCGRYLLN